MKNVFKTNGSRIFPGCFMTEKNSMTCSLCIKHKKHNSFTDINKNFRTSTLTRHADSSDHKAAVLADSMTGDLQRSVKHIFDEKESSVSSALKVVYWMAKEDISITKYDSLLNLLENLDCPNISGLKCGKSVSRCMEIPEWTSEWIGTDLNGLKRTGMDLKIRRKVLYYTLY